MIVNDLFYENTSLNFGDEIEKICNDRYEGEKNDAKTLKKVRQTRRHKDINKAALTFNNLLKILERHGFELKKRYTKSSYKTLRMDKITDVLFEEKIIVDSKQIVSIGKMINSVIVKTFKKGPYKTTMIEGRNPVIINILKQLPMFNTLEMMERKWVETNALPEPINMEAIELPEYIPIDENGEIRDGKENEIELKQENNQTSKMKQTNGKQRKVQRNGKYETLNSMDLNELKESNEFQQLNSLNNSNH